MGIADYDKLDSITKVADMKFSEYFADRVPGQWSEIASEVDAGLGSEVEMHWGQSLAKTRKWIGDKEFDSARLYKFAFSGYKLHRSLSLSHERIRRDRSGLVGKLIDDFYKDAADKIYDEEVTDFLASNPAAYDGQALISASHQDGQGATWSNLSSTTFATAYGAVFQHRVYKENGDEIPFTPTEVWVGLDLEKEALQETGATVPVNVDSSGAYDQAASVVGMAMRENVYGGRLQVRVIRDMPAGKFLFVDGAKSMKPILIGLDEPVRNVSLTEMTDLPRFMRDEALFSIEGRISLAAGPPQLVYGNL